MDIIEMLWLPPIRWAICLAVYATLLFFIYRFVARCLRRSKLYKKLRDRFKVARFFPKKKPKKKVSSRTGGPPKKEKKVVLSEFIKKVRIRGGIRREYLIVLIPAVIGIMVAIFGVVFFVSDQVDSESDALGQVPLSTPTPSTTSESGENEPKNRDENAFLLNIVIVIAVLIALAPYGFYVYVQKRRRIRHEQEFARFLFELSELLRGGLDPVAGVIELAASATPDVYRGMESLAPHIDLLAKQLKWGMTFEEGMFDLSKQLKSKFIEKYTYLVVQASRIGGGIGDVILQCSTDMEKTFALEREKDAELKEFIMIIYIAQFILVGMLLMLLQMLIPALQGIAMTPGDDAVTSLGFSISPVNIDFPMAFFHVIMINGFASGIIGGIMSEGDARQGIKHSVVLMTVSLIVCLIFLI